MTESELEISKRLEIARIRIIYLKEQLEEMKRASKRKVSHSIDGKRR